MALVVFAWGYGCSGGAARKGVGKGARVVNEGGGSLAGALMTPAVVYPVTPAMRLWREEQFGPVLPVAVFSDVGEVLEHARTSEYAQQAALFTRSAAAAAPLIDALSNAVGRVNLKGGGAGLPGSGAGREERRGCSRAFGGRAHSHPARDRHRRDGTSEAAAGQRKVHHRGSNVTGRNDGGNTEYRTNCRIMWRKS